MFRGCKKIIEIIKKVVATPIEGCYNDVSQDDRELAQLVERHPYKVDVVGSNPAFPTIFHNGKCDSKPPHHGGFLVSRSIHFTKFKKTVTLNM